MEPFNWGILSTAEIGRGKVIPALQRSRHGRVAAIASRDLGVAERVAAELGIPKAYGSYEELLADPGIDGIYNPLPNHLHVPWSIKALEAGKPVLCEKPLALTAAEARTLVEARDRTGTLVVEAFVPRHHPQWLRTRELVRSGDIGQLRLVQGTFTYMLTDTANVRNLADIGGGGVYDIGCYPIMIARFLFAAEPKRALALVERDPEMGIDRLASVVLDFERGHASFTCATQLVPFQRMQILGTKGRVEVEVPFNAPPDRPCRIFVDDGSEVGGRSATTETFATMDQYSAQGDAFAEAVRGIRPVEFPLEDAVLNMRVIDAVYRSGESGTWESLQAEGEPEPSGA